MATLMMSGGDTDSKLPTLHDLQELFEELMLRQEAHLEAQIAKQRSALLELASEVRYSSSCAKADRVDVFSPAPTSYSRGGSGEIGKPFVPGDCLLGAGLSTKDSVGCGAAPGATAYSRGGSGEIGRPLTSLGAATLCSNCAGHDFTAHASFRPKASMASSTCFREGMKEARFSMARALGFESESPMEEDMTCAIAANQAEQTRNSTDASSAHPATLYERSSSFISKKAQQVAMQDITGIHRVLRSVIFENACGSVILLNAILIGVHAHRRALHPDLCERFWEDVFFGFNIFFFVELGVRIFTFRWEFFFGRDCRWNMFDTLIVLSGIFEEVFQRSGNLTDCAMGGNISGRNAASGITALRIIRVLRIVRIVRAFRTMSIFRELRLMVASTLNCLVPLLWASLLLGFIQWCFSVYFVHLTTDYVAQALHEQGPSALTDPTKPYMVARTYFGSVFASVYTLFMSITGGINWDEAAQSLYEVSGQQHAIWLYIVFIAITVFAVLNVITGVFVENATKIALRDRELIIQDTLQKREQYKKHALEVFHEADADGSGQVSFEEFVTLLADPRVQAFFENLELDVMGAQRMFRLLDLDGNGLVSPQEFVTGCMCLKGDAKAMDIAALLLEFHKMSKKFGTSMKRLEHDVALMANSLGQQDIEL